MANKRAETGILFEKPKFVNLIFLRTYMYYLIRFQSIQVIFTVFYYFIVVLSELLFFFKLTC